MPPKSSPDPTGTPPDEGRTGRRAVRRAAYLGLGAAALGALALAVTPALAQDVQISLGEGTTLTERAVQLIGLLTVLSLAPSILVMTTSFIRIVVVLSLLRTAIGLQSAPPNSVMVALALFLTAFIMAPTFETAYTEGVQPVIEGTIELEEGFARASAPLHAFMRQHVREDDLSLFIELSRQPAPATPEEVSLRILIPAFMISELRRAFEIGFLIYLPFVIIDLVVSSILMAMGMMMLPPVVVSLPFKLIFFVLVDGWSLLAASLVRSFGA